MQTQVLRGGLGVAFVGFMDTRLVGDCLALRKSRLAKARQVSWGKNRKEARSRFKARTGRDSSDTIECGDGYAAF